MYGIILSIGSCAIYVRESAPQQAHQRAKDGFRFVADFWYVVCGTGVFTNA